MSNKQKEQFSKLIENETVSGLHKLLKQLSWHAQYKCFQPKAEIMAELVQIELDGRNA